jgi:hypothetical protein
MSRTILKLPLPGDDEISKKFLLSLLSFILQYFRRVNHRGFYRLKTNREESH